MFPVLSLYVVLHHMAYFINVPCRKRINQTKKVEKKYKN